MVILVALALLLQYQQVVFSYYSICPHQDPGITVIAISLQLYVLKPACIVHDIFCYTI